MTFSVAKSIDVTKSLKKKEEEGNAVNVRFVIIGNINEGSRLSILGDLSLRLSLTRGISINPIGSNVSLSGLILSHFYFQKIWQLFVGAYYGFKYF